MRTLIVDDDGCVCEPVDIPFLRSPYNYDRDAASVRSGLNCTDETRTRQEYKEECDINVIMNRFGLSGQLPQGIMPPLVGDFTHVRDYHESLNLLIEADEAFMQLPATIRERFQNNAGKFVDFVSDSRNIQQCREWGIFNPEPVVEAKDGAPQEAS